MNETQLLQLYPLAMITATCLVAILALFLSECIKKIKRLHAQLAQVTLSFNNLDEQAKLIIRTDLELNRTQEDLDRRLAGLDALQKISRLITTTLDEAEIFRRLSQPVLLELGYEKYLLFIMEKGIAPRCYVTHGFEKNKAQEIAETLCADQSFMNALTSKNIVSNKNLPPGAGGQTSQLLNLRQFLISPILSQNDLLGVIVVGNQSEDYILTPGDEELLSVLSDQIGQAMENARLFEEVYRSSQLLETKVQDRTKQLSSALEEVKKVSNAKSEFISAVSHELRTPLTSIKGYASILITGKVGDIPDQVKERLEKINKHSDNLVKLINDLLDISRIESGRAEMEMARTNIRLLIDGVHDLLAPLLKDKIIHFSALIPEHTPEVLLDRSQIDRVMINLISNAIKFTPEQGEIQVIVEAGPQELTISVKDNGIGIKEEDLSRLFDEFFRVENEINQNVKGTGLGLALTKKIIEAHQGRIWITSTAKQGACFSFTLPYQQK